MGASSGLAEKEKMLAQQKLVGQKQQQLPAAGLEQARKDVFSG